MWRFSFIGPKVEVSKKFSFSSKYQYIFKFIYICIFHSLNIFFTKLCEGKYTFIATKAIASDSTHCRKVYEGLSSDHCKIYINEYRKMEPRTSVEHKEL